jgi:2-amino-4-hydroxy-6-hydroxymethyldihydropteridine diphosphokinase
LGLGSNIENPMRILKKAVFFLLRDKKIAPLQSFYILKNPPFGYLEQPYFYNTALLVQTNLAPKAFLRKAKVFPSNSK